MPFNKDNITAVLNNPEQKEKWKKRIQYWKSYPDVFYSQIKGKNAPYGTLFFNDFALRVAANYRAVFFACTRGFTKTYTNLRQKFHKCIFYPGVVETIVAPTKEQGAKVVREALDALIKNYPCLTNEYTIKTDTRDSLILLFNNSSVIRVESTANTARGGNDTDIGIEEMAQREFNHKLFNDAFIPRLRLLRRIHGKVDDSAPFLQKIILTSVRNKQNPSYKYYESDLNGMIWGKDSYVVQSSIETPIMFGLLPRSEIEERRAKMTLIAYEEEYGAIWSGVTEGYMIKDIVIEKSRILKYAEFEHCGNPECIYFVCSDIAREDGVDCAYTSIVVFKLTPIDVREHPYDSGKFWKDLVFIKRYKDADHREIARIIKDYAKRYKAHEVIIDANGLGVYVRDELMYDLEDGNPPYAVKNDKDGKLDEKTLPGAVEILYALKASTAEDAETLTIPNAQVEFEHGRVRLLVDENVGVDEYKKAHRIKDDIYDTKIASPYRETSELEDEIRNLVQKSEGHTIKEKRRNKRLPRDTWSAVKYCLWRIKAYEDSLIADSDDNISAWHEQFEKQPLSDDNTFSDRFALPDYRYTSHRSTPFAARQKLF